MIKIKIERQIKKWGEHSLVLVIPPDLAKHLEVCVDDVVEIQDEEGSKGKFCSFWKKSEKLR